MRLIDIETITQEELKALPYSTGEIVGKEYTQVIIVPTGEIHDSGFGCMKCILCKWTDEGNEVVGVVGGYTDAIHLRGVKPDIDCLPCGLLRVFFEKGGATVPFFVGSDLFVGREGW